MKSFVALLLLLTGCARATQTSSLTSGRNNVACEADGTGLHTENLAGITINDRGISTAEKRRHLDELNAMPAPFLAVLKTKSLAINLTAGTVTDFPAFSYLRDVVPPGWSGTGFSWKDIPGTGVADGVYLGDSHKANNAASLAVHETTHTVDLALGLTDTDPEIKALYEAQKTKPSPEDANGAYRMSNLLEFLAVAVDDYYCSAATRANLAHWYPDTFAFVKNDLMRHLADALTASESTGGSYDCTPCQDGRQYCGSYSSGAWRNGAWRSCR